MAPARTGPDVTLATVVIAVGLVAGGLLAVVLVARAVEQMIRAYSRGRVSRPPEARHR